jgi:hypothetical protein
MTFRPQGTPADQTPSNIFAGITRGQKCELTSTATPVIVTPANARNQAGTPSALATDTSWTTLATPPLTTTPADLAHALCTLPKP